ncbi:AraC-like DNA-binding protein [Algoriphagus antarcticus]|uniref:AraC-like DNA-binding protein n=2 Tax=Algoriphagus antarcticus TaxID=238540 RepID=A0A3E0DVJ1_9BACT|nr:AraC-like DNA-binding protein [Algoriphagus antarcticus]
MNGEFLKLLISIQFLVYLFASFKVWLQHSVMIQNYYASLEKIRINWLRNILIGMCFIYLISLSSFVFTGAEILKLAPLLGAVLIYVTAYLGMKHSRLFATAEVMEPSPAHFQQKNDNYRNSTLGEDRKQEILFKMKDCMQHEKLFTDNKLTLPKLAARMEVSTHHLSQVLNENLGQTFFDYVNEFRVKEVQKLMIDPAYAHYSLLGMAMEAGFNSKSAFNTAFKKHTQQTPLEYRNSFQQKHEIKSDPIGKGASW